MEIKQTISVILFICFWLLLAGFLGWYKNIKPDLSADTMKVKQTGFGAVHQQIIEREIEEPEQEECFTPGFGCR